MASELNTPPVLLKPFADSGDKNNIPETATGTQQASLDEGFPPVTSLPLTQGGIPPERKDFNGLGNLLSKQYFYLQNGGRFTFNQSVSDAIGGYPQNATLWFKDEALGISYPVTSLINNNTYNFVTTPSYIDGIKWKRVIDSFPSTQITNCLTEIPQDIKLELSSGTLKLKAGSEVYVPNGAGVFDTVTIASDITVTKNTNESCFVFYINNTLYVWEVSGATSGSTAPSGTGTWYDTTNNKIKRYVSGSQTLEGLSLPIAIVGFSNGAISSIDQVFNGFGYIGSTLFALPGIKGLIPNGRNDDGTLKNIEIVSSQVWTRTWLSNPNYHDLSLATSGIGINTNPYNANENFVYNAGGAKVTDRVVFGRMEYNSSSPWNVTKLLVKTAFHAVDYNDYQALSNKVDTNTSNITTLQSTKQDEATAVNYDNISNCITEIPQDIKVELSSGTLTLKAGSKLYVPNGANTFDEVIIDSDKSGYGTLAHTRPCFMFYNTISQNIERLEVEKSYSGTTDPVSGTWHIWYDTTNNICYMVSNTDVQIRISLPFAIVTFAGDNTKTITSIDQVFNGFGYIGSTLFALPGIKGLIPNGRNDDGTLNNIEFTVSNVLVQTNTYSSRDFNWFIYNNSSVTEIGYPQISSRTQPSGTYQQWYNFETNQSYNTTTGIAARRLSTPLLGFVAGSDGRITSLTPKTAFHAVDYNDAMLKSDLIMVSSTPPADADPDKFYYTAES